MRTLLTVPLALLICGCAAQRVTYVPGPPAGALSEYERAYLAARALAAQAAASRPESTEMQPWTGETSIGPAQPVGALADAVGGYLAQVGQKIRGNWGPEARPLFPGAMVVVHFIVLRTGEVKDPAVEWSSGSPDIDALALRAVRQATPLPAFPDGLAAPFLDLRYQFVVAPQ